jgi:hypothetical protein
MSAKIILIFIGSIVLLLGIILLISAKQHNFEVKEYKKISKKDAPKKIATVSYIIGGLLTTIGLVLLVWSIAIHTGHLPNHEIVTTPLVGIQPKSKFM